MKRSRSWILTGIMSSYWSLLYGRRRRCSRKLFAVVMWTSLNKNTADCANTRTNLCQARPTNRVTRTAWSKPFRVHSPAKLPLHLKHIFHGRRNTYLDPDYKRISVRRSSTQVSELVRDTAFLLLGAHIYIMQAVFLAGVTRTLGQLDKLPSASQHCSKTIYIVVELIHGSFSREKVHNSIWFRLMALLTVIAATGM